MNDKKLSPNAPARNRALGLIVLTSGLVLFALFVSSAWNQPARASIGLFSGSTATPIPTDDGVLDGKVVSLTITTVVTITSPTIGLTPTPDSGTPVLKVPVCHAPAAYNTPYVVDNVSINSVESALTAGGHGDHTGPVYPAANWGDIIPPYTYSYNGQTVHYPGYNWTSMGIHIWIRGCNTDDIAKDGTLIVQSFDYTCLQSSDPPGYYGTTYEYHGGTWWPINTFLMTAAMCTPDTTTVVDEYKDYPCAPVIGPTGVLIECKPNPSLLTFNVHADVSTSCPINKVLRAPYPRSLVNVDTNFILQWQDYDSEGGNSSAPQSPDNLSDFVDANGNPTELGYSVGIWRNLVLTMRSERLQGGMVWFGQTVPNPQWLFEDRTWNTDRKYPTHQQGILAKFNYETSSAGLPNMNGRSYNPIYKVPADSYSLAAYSVIVKTFCGQQIKESVEVAQRTWTPDGKLPKDCFKPDPPLNPDGSTNIPPGTSQDGCPAGKVAYGHWVYSWKSQTTDWAGVDETLTGSTTTYKTRLQTKAGGVLNNITYWDLPDGLWVPVVEIQSVLRDKCVSEGTCLPPPPDIGSLAP